MGRASRAALVESPYTGVDDTQPVALPSTPLSPGDRVVFLRGATLANQKLLTNGLGFDIHFTIPLTEKHKIPDLLNALQRMVDIDITRYDKDRDDGD